MPTIVVEGHVMIPGRYYSTTGEYRREQIQADTIGLAIAEFNHRHPGARQVMSVGLHNRHADWVAAGGASYGGATFIDCLIPVNGWTQRHDPRFGMCLEALQ